MGRGYATRTRSTWQGIAAVTTNVELRATAGGNPVTGTGSFRIESRIGTVPGWIEAEAPGFPVAPPTPTFVSGAPLAVPYPGIITGNSGGYTPPEGALGVTYFNFPVEASIGAISSGPNQGVRYLRSVTWQANPASGRAVPAIFVSNALPPTDPFFQRQVGGSGHCTQAHMQALRNLILNHENTHWTAARAAILPLKTQTVFEGLTQLPGTPPIAAAYTTARTAYVQAITQANANVETSRAPVDPNAPVCDMRP